VLLEDNDSVGECLLVGQCVVGARCMRCGHAPQGSAPRGPWRPLKTLVAALVCVLVRLPHDVGAAPRGAPCGSSCRASGTPCADDDPNVCAIWLLIIRWSLPSGATCLASYWRPDLFRTRTPYSCFGLRLEWLAHFRLPRRRRHRRLPRGLRRGPRRDKGRFSFLPRDSAV
jgi:hypothetical protein